MTALQLIALWCKLKSGLLSVNHKKQFSLTRILPFLASIVIQIPNIIYLVLLVVFVNSHEKKNIVLIMEQIGIAWQIMFKSSTNL